MKHFVLLILGIHLSACSSSSTGFNLFDDSVEVEHLMLANSFILPESQGKILGANIKLGLAGTDSVKLVEDIDNITLSSNPELKHGATTMANIELGIVSHLDFYYNNGAGIKLQIWGNAADTAKAGNFSIALTGQQIAVNNKVSTSDTTGSVKEAEAKIEGQGFHYALLLGYRNNNNTLIYGGPFYSETDVEKLSVYQTNNTDFSATTEIATGQGRVKGIYLGIYNQTRKNWFATLSTGVGLEVAYTLAEWTNTTAIPNEDMDNEGFHLGGVVSLGW
ncbi:MAG: hypothetical protein KDD40_06805 [Bdellovibrionales bacterium]|nr:hypothetical protein [Bdellovibrionales bacterium]